MPVVQCRLTPKDVVKRESPCVLIDDCGTPGQQAGSPYLDPSRKTWVAVMTSCLQFGEIVEQIPGALDELSLHTGATEFHFTDIYGGAEQFSQVPLAIRVALFSFMRDIFNTYKFPVIVQTLSASDLSDMHARRFYSDKVAEFNLREPGDAALLLLLFRIRRFLGDHAVEYPRPAYVLLDEGFRPAGR